MHTALFRKFCFVSLIAYTTFAKVAAAQNSPASGPPQSEVFPQTLPPQPAPSSDPLISPDPLSFALDPWNKLKAKADQDLGLRFQGSYTVHNQYATQTLSPRHDEPGGRLDLGIDWTLLHNGKDTGELVILARSSENFGMSQDFAISDEVGSIMGTNSLHGGGKQLPDTLNQLYWRQTFFDQKFAISVGKLHPNNWIDLSPIANDETRQFMAGAYTGDEANNGMGAWTPGVALEYKVTDHVYLHGVVANSLGKTGTSGLNNLGRGHFYEAAEIGYKTGEPNGPQGNYRLTAFHTDQGDGHRGFGASVGFDQEIADGWAPFGRVGYMEPDGGSIQNFVSVGIANLRPFDRRGDMFGIGGTFSRPSNSNLHEECLFEAFYRVKLTGSLEFSPDIQWVLHPAFQPEADNVFVFGARLKFLF